MNKIKELCLKEIKDKKLSAEYTDRLEEECKHIELNDREDFILERLDEIKSGKRQKNTHNKNGLVFAYLLGITDVDPIKNNIPHIFSLGDAPDTDVDLSAEAKDLVEDYLVEKHGQDNVGHIMTVGYYSPKSTIRMICRSMSLTNDMGVVKEISDYFGIDVGEGNDLETQIQTFKKAKKNLSKKTQDFLKSKPEYVKFLPKEHKDFTCEEILFEYALKINGQVDKTGKHASGIAVSAEPFKNFAPLKKVRGEILLGLQEGGHAKEVSAFGILKFDWLGLINVSKNKKMFDSLNHYYEIDGDKLYRDIVFKGEYNDKDVIEMFNNGDTIGVFQFGSDGIRNCLKQAEIKSFNDVVLINGIFRPGSLSQFDDLVQRMRNPETITYEHPDLEKALGYTYGLVVFQEQTMQMMQIVGGLTLNEADKARSILKKLTRNKNPDKNSIEYYEYKQMLDKFKKGAKKKGFTDKQTDKFVQLLAEAQGYSFNLSHATAYSALGFIDCYFKAHYPLIFYKVLCDFEDDRQTLSQLFSDAKIRSVNIGNFDINKTKYEFEIDVKTNTILPGFKMIKGVSKKIIDELLNERDKNNGFDNIVDFFVSLDNIKFNIKSIVPLIELGSFNDLYPNRRMLMQLFTLFQEYQKKKKLKTESKRIKFEDIFKMIKLYDLEDYTLFEKLEIEQKYLEMYISSDPMSYAKTWYEQQGVQVCSISERESETDNVIAFVSDYKLKKTKTKKNYLEMMLSDGIDTIKMRVWENRMNPDLQRKGAIICFRASYDEMFNSYSLISHHILEEK